MVRSSENSSSVQSWSGPRLVLKRKTFSNREIKVTRLESESEDELEDGSEANDTCNTTINQLPSTTTEIEPAKASDESSEISSLDGFICSSPENDSISDSTSTPELQIDLSNSDTDAEDDVYEVERILKVRAFKLDNEIFKQYQVKWKNYIAPTWVNEMDLMCPEILEEFHTKRGSRAVEVCAGTTDLSKDFNIDNWVTPSQVLQTIASYRNSNKHKVNVRVEIFEGLKESDTLYVLYHNCHYYILLHYTTENLIYISDGTNVYSRDKRVRKEINQMVGKRIKIIVLLNTVQSNQDYCGSSAAAIAITFLQKYKSGIWNNPIQIPKSVVKRLTRIMHKGQSPFIKSFTPINNLAIHCDTCGKRFFKHNKHRAHKLSCGSNKRQKN